MRLSKRELAAECDYLSRVLGIIDQRGATASVAIAERKEKVQAFKRYIWETTGEVDPIELAANRQSADFDSRRLDSERAVLLRLLKARKSPYFGRIDFQEESEPSEPIYIGLMQINEHNSIYVYDWRAPISSMFYEYGLGPASYEAPVGKISGKITLRRQFRISDSVLLRCFESDVNVLDDYLQEVLSQSSSEKLRHIVTTIQQEQNRIIRNLEDRFLVVQGVAGSGKTSVALHRIAYLLYKDKKLSSNNILILSPNSVFSEYISDVLPDLGEENTLQTTFSEFASSYLPEFSSIEPFTAFIERAYKGARSCPGKDETVTFKLSDAFKYHIHDFVTRTLTNARFSQDVKIFGRRYESSRLTALFRKCAGITLLEKTERLADLIANQLGVVYDRDEKRIFRLLFDQLKISYDIRTLYRDLLLEIAARGHVEIGGIDAILNRQVPYEDCIAMLYLKFCVFGFHKDGNVKHVVIDEAQDYNLMQIDILTRIFEDAAFTILGDVNQTINPFYKYMSLSEVEQSCRQRSSFIELKKAYRSTEEIINYTNGIVNTNNVNAIRHKNGRPVKFKKVEQDQVAASLSNDVHEMRQRGFRSIAIITKTDWEARQLFKELNESFPDLLYVGANTEKFSKTLVVLPSYIAKGLEFDGVVVYSDMGNPYGVHERFLYYVVCTRAQHELIVYNQDESILEAPRRSRSRRS